MKKKIRFIFIIIGILLICYPLIGKFLSSLNQTSVIEKYKEKIAEMSEDDIENLRELYQNGNVDNTGEILGYIEIDKINLYLPIYEGTTDDILLKGIGHLENTDLPFSDDEYHSVFAGHTGITSKTLFDNLIDLELDDYFSIIILDYAYEYRVCDIKIVLPTETRSLITESSYNKKLVTLVTCTPKYVNSHRLLVTGEFVKKLKIY